MDNDEYDLQDCLHDDYTFGSIDCNLFMMRLERSAKLKVLLKQSTSTMNPFHIEHNILGLFTFLPRIHPHVVQLKTTFQQFPLF